MLDMLEAAKIGRSSCTASELRAGDQTAPLFVFPGLSGRTTELAKLAARLKNGRAVFRLHIDDLDSEGAPNSSLAQLAGHALARIQTMQPGGPYHLMGYSIGGLIAFEVAQRLRDNGEEVALLVLVETAISERYWPLRTWFRSITLRAANQLQTLALLPLHIAMPLLIHRSARLARRLRDRLAPTVRLTRPSVPRSRAFLPREDAMEAYRPEFYPGKLIFFKSSQELGYFCDLGDLWRDRAAAVEIYTFSTDHRGLARDDVIGLMADRVERCLSNAAPTLAAETASNNLSSPVATFSSAASARPKVLITTTCRWHSTARLALALTEAGFKVDARCPSGHPMGELDFVGKIFSFNPLSPIWSLARVVAVAEPQLIVPGDDLARLHLQQLYSAALLLGNDSEALRDLICRSLGRPEYFGVVQSRAGSLDLARAAQIRIPETKEITNQSELDVWLEAHDCPVVVKTDFSFGGRGVIIAQSQSKAAQAFSALAAPPSLTHVVKRAILDRDLKLLLPFFRRTRHRVSIQAFVEGTDANVAVACWRGEVLGQVCVEVLRAAWPMGPATVVRYIDHAEIDDAVRRIVSQMGMSGFCGFDFMLRGSDRAAHLIEVNPRATQTAHLPTNDGRSLMAAIYARSLGLPQPAPGPAPPHESVALFPGEFCRDRRSPFLVAGCHDVPWQSARLVELGLKEPHLPAWKYLDPPSVGG
jgi:thioesterase domain-containing protein